MRYLVKNTVTGEETICEKVVVDGEDYYLNNSAIKLDEWCFEIHNGLTKANLKTPKFTDGINTWWLRKLNMSTGANDPECKKVIATTNKSLELPKVIDEVDLTTYAREEHKFNHKSVQEVGFILGIEVGYDKAKETYSYTKDDMVEFMERAIGIAFEKGLTTHTTTELFDIWQEQRTIEILVK